MISSFQNTDTENNEVAEFNRHSRATQFSVTSFTKVMNENIFLMEIILYFNIKYEICHNIKYNIKLILEKNINLVIVNIPFFKALFFPSFN